jgi:hypothetical protein
MPGVALPPSGRQTTRSAVRVPPVAPPPAAVTGTAETTPTPTTRDGIEKSPYNVLTMIYI